MWWWRRWSQWGWRRRTSNSTTTAAATPPSGLSSTVCRIGGWPSCLISEDIPSKIPVNAFGKVSVEGLWNVPIRRLNQRFPRCAEITKNPHQGCLWRGVLGGVQASLIIILSIHISNLQESKWKICWRNPEGIEGNGKGNPYSLSTVGSMGEICCKLMLIFFFFLRGVKCNIRMNKGARSILFCGIFPQGVGGT